MPFNSPLLDYFEQPAVVEELADGTIYIGYRKPFDRGGMELDEYFDSGFKIVKVCKNASLPGWLSVFTLNYDITVRLFASGNESYDKKWSLRETYTYDFLK